MRYDRQHKARTHARIVEAAGRKFREAGYEGAGVDAIMRAAGLTVGGFYAHFRSKEALFAEAVADALRREWARWFDGLEELEGEAFRRSAARRYLSAAHRGRRADGCPVAALATDLGRAPDEVRDAIEQVLRERLAAPPLAAEGDRALALLALCVGGLALCRAVRSPGLSDRILRACRAAAEEVRCR